MTETKSPPGDTIKDALKEKGVSQDDFLISMQGTLTHVESLLLLEGKTAITLPVAEKLTEVLGSSVQFWLTREAQYRDFKVVGRPSRDAEPVLVYLPDPIVSMIRRVAEAEDRFFVESARLNNDQSGFPTHFAIEVSTGARIEAKAAKKAKRASKKKARKV